MVVIVILGILAALVVPKVLERPDEARAIAAKSDIAAIMQALKLYRLDNQRYPTGEQGLAALIAKPEQPPVPPNWKPGGYLEKLPKDPWGRPYVYLNPGVRGEIDVFSFGADGQPGGSGHRRRRRLVGPVAAARPRDRRPTRGRRASRWSRSSS